jgi:hypothetical protein
LGGDLNVCYLSPVSRLPGYFNHWYLPSHFITYETTSYEYSLEGFEHFLYPSPKSLPMESDKHIDSNLITDFFRLLYRNCTPGLLRVVVLRYDPLGITIDPRVPIAYRDDALKLDFEIPKDFDQIFNIFKKYQNPPDHPWHFTPHFYFRPFVLDNRGAISQIPSLWIDCDRFTPDIEAKLKAFPPSISLQTSPQHYHFFWILKQPLGLKETDAVIKIQQRLAKAFMGDPLLTWNSYFVSWVPGSLNIKYCMGDEPPLGGIPETAFQVTYSATQREYTLKDFQDLPYLPLSDHLRSFAKLVAFMNAKNQ